MIVGQEDSESTCEENQEDWKVPVLKGLKDLESAGDGGLGIFGKCR